jgi:hypothetical protein
MTDQLFLDSRLGVKPMSEETQTVLQFYSFAIRMTKFCGKNNHRTANKPPIS